VSALLGTSTRSSGTHRRTDSKIAGLPVSVNSCQAHRAASLGRTRNLDVVGTDLCPPPPRRRRPPSRTVDQPWVRTRPPGAAGPQSSPRTNPTEPGAVELARQLTTERSRSWRRRHPRAPRRLHQVSSVGQNPEHQLEESETKRGGSMRHRPVGATAQPAAKRPASCLPTFVPFSQLPLFRDDQDHNQREDAEEQAKNSPA
jgi:hypothetical protein